MNNAYPDTSITRDLPAADALWSIGLMVDVKNTTYSSGHLLVTKWKAGNGVDVYCLVVGSFPRYRIAGYMTKEQMLSVDRLKDLGHGEGYAASQDELSR